MLDRLRQILRVIAIWAMLLPFVSTSLIASGLMPAANADGVITLVICTDAGMAEMAFDAATLEPITDADGDKEPAKKADYCAFAALHPVAHLTETASLHLPEPALHAMTTITSETVLHAAAKTGLPPATGPPFTL